MEEREDGGAAGDTPQLLISPVVCWVSEQKRVPFRSEEQLGAARSRWSRLGCEASSLWDARTMMALQLQFYSNASDCSSPKERRKPRRASIAKRRRTWESPITSESQPEIVFAEIKDCRMRGERVEEGPILLADEVRFEHVGDVAVEEGIYEAAVG